MPVQLNSVALMLTLLSGLVGGAVTSQLALRGLVPHLFPPRTIQVRSAFRLIDNGGWLRSQLGKNGFTMFAPKTREVVFKLDSQRAQLTLYNGQANTSVRLTPVGPYAIQAAQSVAPHSSVRLSQHQSSRSSPKPGIFIKDGKVVWEVP